ncbi:hypothetical protein BR93DRAFT_395837 [Coniochaeta sp. PMI_546]|nr:hypothetical protein BR93DRAFT_395837 [Coniochaeta sp. PMI_546]
MMLLRKDAEALRLHPGCTRVYFSVSGASPYQAGVVDATQGNVCRHQSLFIQPWPLTTSMTVVSLLYHILISLSCVSVVRHTTRNW